MGSYYHEDEEQLGFYKKYTEHEKFTDIKTQGMSKKRMFL